MSPTILSESQREVREAVATLCSQFSNAYWQERDQTGTDPKDFHKAIAAGGWLGVALSEQYGGSGLGMAEASVMMQAITESGAGMQGAQSIHANVYAIQPLAMFGTEAQRATIIPKIVSGEWRTCFGVTEPNVGLDTTSLRTTATRTNEGWRIDGQKIWITCAQQAKIMILLARTTSIDHCAKKTEGLSLFAIPVDKEAPGLSLRRIVKMGGRGVDANEVFFDGYKVPGDSLIGGEESLGKGFKMILHGMNAERCLIAAEALGLGYAALSRASKYAQDRIVFGRPIGKNQAISHPLAAAYAGLEAAALSTYHAARLFDSSQNDKSQNVSSADVGVAANMAKYLAGEAAFKACETAVLTLGGMGYAAEYDVERWFRECLVNRIAPVSREMILNYIAERVLALPKSY